MKNKLISSILEYDSKSNTTYLTHGIFRWYGKLVPQLVGDMLDQYCESGDNIVANFNGSGTIALEAMTRGINTIGTDINPLALLVSKVKTTKIPSFNIDDTITKVINTAESLTVSTEEVDKLYEPYKWYSGDTSFTLIKLKKAIIECCDGQKDIKDLLMVSLLSIVRECSNIDTRCVNHIVVDKNRPIPDVISKFKKEAKYVFDCVMQLNDFDNVGSVEFKDCDARTLSFINDNSKDLVFSHPPYLNAINYYNIHRLCTDLADFDYKEIREEDFSSKNYSVFLSFMRQSFKEAYRVLKPDKKLVVVIGDVRYKGNILTLGVDFVNELKELGFEIEDIFIWILTKKAGMSVARRGNHIDHNYVIVAKKRGD